MRAIDETIGLIGANWYWAQSKGCCHYGSKTLIIYKNTFKIGEELVLGANFKSKTWANYNTKGYRLILRAK